MEQNGRDAHMEIMKETRRDSARLVDILKYELLASDEGKETTPGAIRLLHSLEEVLKG